MSYILSLVPGFLLREAIANTTIMTTITSKMKTDGSTTAATSIPTFNEEPLARTAETGKRSIRRYETVSYSLSYTTYSGTPLFWTPFYN